MRLLSGLLPGDLSPSLRWLPIYHFWASFHPWSRASKVTNNEHKILLAAAATAGIEGHLSYCTIFFGPYFDMQANTLTPLLGGCTAAYFVSFFLMENTIMTEKIARRGIHTPHSYAPDLLDSTLVKSIMKEAVRLLSADNTIGQVRSWLAKEHISAEVQRTFAVVDQEQQLIGTVNLYEITDGEKDPNAPITTILVPRTATIYEDNSLRVAVDILAKLKPGLLPVVSRTDKNKLMGLISHDDILQALRLQKDDLEHMQRTISLKRRSFQIIVRGRKLWHK